MTHFDTGEEEEDARDGLVSQLQPPITLFPHIPPLPTPETPHTSANSELYYAEL